MNSLLMKHKPKDVDAEKWKQTWENSHYILEPLAKALQEMIESRTSVNPKDFDCPNHYAKLAYQLGEKSSLEFVLGLLPKTN